MRCVRAHRIVLIDFSPHFASGIPLISWGRWAMKFSFLSSFLISVATGSRHRDRILTGWTWTVFCTSCTSLVHGLSGGHPPSFSTSWTLHFISVLMSYRLPLFAECRISSIIEFLSQASSSFLVMNWRSLSVTGPASWWLSLSLLIRFSLMYPSLARYW